MRRLKNIINFSFIGALVWGLIVYQKQSLGFNKSHRVSSISFSRAFISDTSFLCNIQMGL